MKAHRTDTSITTRLLSSQSSLTRPSHDINRVYKICKTDFNLIKLNVSAVTQGK